MTRLNSLTLKRIEQAGDEGYRTTDRTIEALYNAFSAFGSEPISIGDLSVDYHPPVEPMPKVSYDQYKIRRLRAIRGYSLEKLAEKSGLTAPGIHALEKRARPTAKAETIVKLAKGLGVPVGEISQPLDGVWGYLPSVSPPRG
jgi:DNA-binding XRE family transcriptional regulator